MLDIDRRPALLLYNLIIAAPPAGPARPRLAAQQVSTGRAAKLAASSAAEFTFLGFSKPLNSQSLSGAMEAGPLSSSLLARREEVAEQQQQVISDDQIRQLLIFMGTITVISFVLVIALITVFIAFIW